MQWQHQFISKLFVDCFFVSFSKCVNRRRCCQQSYIRISKSLHLIYHAQLICILKVSIYCSLFECKKERTTKIKEKEKEKLKQTKTAKFKNKLAKFYFQLQVRAFDWRVLYNVHCTILEMVSKGEREREREDEAKQSLSCCIL